ncbi:MAG: rRNA adenine N-6-methyltransferase family protein [Candidatus Actinomarina sp.]
MSEVFWISKLKIKPKKSLGQNFLIDSNISRKITKLVQGQLADPILEIGPGTGSLTNELLKDNYRIKAIEVDNRINKYTWRTFWRSSQYRNY